MSSSLPGHHHMQKTVTFTTWPSPIFFLKQTPTHIKPDIMTSTTREPKQVLPSPLHSHLTKFNPDSSNQLSSIEGDNQFSFCNLVDNIKDWQDSFPSTATLYCTRSGKLDNNHYFTQEAAFNMATFHILWSGFLSTNEMTSLSMAHPPLHCLHSTMPQQADCDF